MAGVVTETTTGQLVVRVACPHCEGTLDMCDDLSDGKAFVTHTIPHCEWFATAELPAFLAVIEADPTAKATFDAYVEKKRLS